MKDHMVKLICIVVFSVILTGCAGALNGVFDADGKLTGVEATGPCEGGFKQHADGSYDAWINNKTQLIPSGLIEANAIKGA